MLFRWAAAVTALVLLLAGIYWLAEAPSHVATPSPARLNPGRYEAVLTLSTGKQLVLKGDTVQRILDSGLVLQNHRGLLVYSTLGAVHMHTITAPRGAIFRLVLQDGTRVWLNASSSLTYPTAFAPGRRTVSLSGEAYFEVSKNLYRPFIVKTYRESVQTTGGAFDVNCYPDEPVIKASLVSGAIHVHNYMLEPGQGYANGDLMTTDAASDVSWKDGMLGFSHTDIQVAMRRVSRWFDIDVFYPDGVPVKWITGKLPMNEGGRQTLLRLDSMGVHAYLGNGRLNVALR